MIFHEFGDKKFPHILLIHGGGNSWWNYLRQARMLSDKAELKSEVPVCKFYFQFSKFLARVNSTILRISMISGT